ncbi:MAG: lipocalin family protein [Gammaproteobacteria bacterium]|nr:lipocalin family protein [Gammaproteobacteria bacterium]
MKGVVLLIALLLSACTGIPKNIEPIEDFKVDRYLGTWYEVARLDHRFERGLTNVTATYTLQKDGTIQVLNRGFSTDKEQWNEAIGKAKFVSDSSIGHLKVSFFGPFYASYVVYELDQNEYQYAFVTGNNKKYLWLLSRKPAVEPQLLDRFKIQAEELGYDISELILVEHSTP